MKKLYHGSTYLFTEIDVDRGKGYKDFGRGFYATAVKEHAENLAKRNKRILERRQQVLKKKGIAFKNERIIAYRYNLLFNEDISGLNVKIFEKADIQWVKFILQNRKSPISVHDYDIVIGPTADEQTTLILNQYEQDLINSNYAEEILMLLIDELKPENLPKQYFFGTRKALKVLEFDEPGRQAVK